MQELLLQYNNYLLNKDRSDYTLRTYTGHIRRFCAYLADTVGQPVTRDMICAVSAEVIEGYGTKLRTDNKKGSTRNNYINALRSFYQYLQKKRMIRDDPTAILSCVPARYNPRTDGKKPYTDDELVSLLQACEGACKANRLRDRAIVLLLLASAMRAFELCSLNVAHLKEMDAGRVRICGKGGDWDEITVASFALPPLHEYLATRTILDPAEPLFLSTHGNRMTPGRVWDALKATQERAGLRTGVHLLRHTTISRVDRFGSAMARDVARHAASSVTDRYTHTTLAEREKAICESYKGFLENFSETSREKSSKMSAL